MCTLESMGGVLGSLVCETPVVNVGRSGFCVSAVDTIDFCLYTPAMQAVVVFCVLTMAVQVPSWLMLITGWSVCNCVARLT